MLPRLTPSRPLNCLKVQGLDGDFFDKRLENSLGSEFVGNWRSDGFVEIESLTLCDW